MRWNALSPTERTLRRDRKRELKRQARHVRRIEREEAPKQWHVFIPWWPRYLPDLKQRVCFERVFRRWTGTKVYFPFDFYLKVDWEYRAFPLDVGQTEPVRYEAGRQHDQAA